MLYRPAIEAKGGSLWQKPASAFAISSLVSGILNAKNEQQSAAFRQLPRGEMGPYAANSVILCRT
jgi:hypothetical protein